MPRYTLLLLIASLSLSCVAGKKEEAAAAEREAKEDDKKDDERGGDKGKEGGKEGGKEARRKP